ncbi:SH3 domain-containing protein [Streptomyces uncialis]|uniref:SH3 domain-containing protein n=1 Tax=Streptomyces uncialis TaxID=1048205 RepID=UPI0037BB96EF
MSENITTTEATATATATVTATDTDVLRPVTVDAGDPIAAAALGIEVMDAQAATTYLVVATVNVRSGPGLSHPVVLQISGGSRVSIICQKPGTTVNGPLGTSNLWDKIGNQRFVSDSYIQTGTDGYVRPQCA